MTFLSHQGVALATRARDVNKKNPSQKIGGHVGFQPFEKRIHFIKVWSRGGVESMENNFSYSKTPSIKEDRVFGNVFLLCTHHFVGVDNRRARDGIGDENAHIEAR